MYLTFKVTSHGVPNPKYLKGKFSLLLSFGRKAVFDQWEQSF